jgi:hypothetical protein
VADDQIRGEAAVDLPTSFGEGLLYLLSRSQILSSLSSPLITSRFLRSRCWPQSGQCVSVWVYVAYDMEAAAEVGMIALGARWAEGSSVREAHPKILEAVFDDVGAFTTWLETHVS